MNDVLRITKKAFTWVTVVATVAWSMGMAAFIAPLTASAATLADGDLIKSDAKGADGKPVRAVYYYAGAKRYVFPNWKTALTWYTEAQLKTTAQGGLVKVIPAAELGTIPMSGNVTYRPGVKLVKIDSDPKVYAVGKNGALQWVTSGDVAATLYGANWSKMVEDVPDSFFTNYTVSTTDIKAAADYSKDAVMAASATIMADKGLTGGTTGGGTGGTGGGTTGGTGGALTVSLTADTPTSAQSIITDAGNNAGGQRSKLAGYRLQSNGGEVRIDSLKFMRTGIAADGDVDNMYLYEGETLVAQVTSVSKGVATFSKTGGLVTVPAGGYKDLWLTIDMNKSAAAGITQQWKLSASDITSNAASASGSAQSAVYTLVVVTDLGFMDVANVSPSAANTTDPQDAYDVWKFRLDANSQDLLVEKLTITNVGSIADTDLQNFSLWYGGTKLGEGKALVSKAVTFDLTGLADKGFKIPSGAQRQLSLRADIKAGTNRTFRFGFQQSYDIKVKDLNYNVYTVPATDDNAAFSVTQAGGATTINTGTLTLTVATDSPTGNVPDGATNVLFAKWNFKAAGEQVKVSTLDVSCSGSDTTNILKNVKILLNGSQVGSTLSSLTCNGSSPSGTDFSFGNSFLVDAGKLATIEFRGDLTDSTVAASETISATLTAGSSNAQGNVSLTALSTSAISGRLVTVASGALVVSRNASLANYTAQRPLGVTGAANVRVGSFVITGGAEPSDVSQVVLKDDVDTTSDTVTLADYFQNLRLTRGATPIGQTISSLTDTDSTTYTFNIAPSVTVGVGETVVIDVWADILSSSGAAVSNVNTDDTNGEIIADSVVATGVNTGTTTSDSASDPQLQDLFIATNGMLRVAIDGDTPADTQLVLGSTDQTFAKFRLSEESNAEDILIKKFVVADTLTLNTAAPFNSTGTLRNLRLYQGATLLGSVSALSDAKNTGLTQAVFDLTGLVDGGYKVKAGQTVTLTVKADLTPWVEGGSSSSTHKFSMWGSATQNTNGDFDRTTTLIQDMVEAVGAGSGFSISSTNSSATSGLVVGPTTGATAQEAGSNIMDAVRTKLTFAISDDTGKVSPSKGSANSGSTVAIWKVSNTANIGGYPATLKQLNLDISQNGLSITAAQTLTIYKEAIDSSNQLAVTSINSENYSDTQIAEAASGSGASQLGFVDLEIAAGTSRYLVITLDLNSGGVTAGTDSLTVGIQTTATGGLSPLQWSDGAALTMTEINGMPLVGRTVSF